MKNELILRTISTILLLPLITIVTILGNIYFKIFLVLCFLLSCVEWYQMNTKKLYKYSGIIFFAFSFYTAFILRINQTNEYEFFILILFICIATDLGGFIFGKIFKGPKLIKLSPNKTYSGMFGSYIFTFISLYFFMSINLFNFLSDNSFIIFFIFVFFISTISQIGDILISYFKRKAKIKDTGKIIPGHGGILDRIDGMILAFPASYIVYISEIIKI